MSKDTKHMIAERAAKEIAGPAIVNLGIGIPTLVPDYVKDETVYIHTENGMLNVGAENPEDIDPELVNAGKTPVSELQGASYFSSSESFSMVRGGHIDITVLGVLQIDERGYIANWTVPGKNIIGVGGAMDLISGVKRVICTMMHTTKTGEAKILHRCTYPITAERSVDMLITDLAVFEFKDGEMYLTELMPGVTREEVREKTEANYIEALKEER